MNAISRLSCWHFLVALQRQCDISELLTVGIWYATQFCRAAFPLKGEWCEARLFVAITVFRIEYSGRPMKFKRSHFAKAKPVGGEGCAFGTGILQADAPARNYVSMPH
ncbi:MAG: hypothetical protein EKK40_10685 [Bradyrhizobiaceae bacterium]|nr:MAG: hypothetical protein EKK40_10685 [Bradyrhizobiaceae bacterium]